MSDTHLSPQQESRRESALPWSIDNSDTKMSRSVEHVSERLFFSCLYVYINHSYLSLACILLTIFFYIY
jgi:hypothetical protein